MKHDNDNDLLPFISIAALTANVVRYLESDKQENERARDNTDSRDAENKKDGDTGRYIDHRLRELAAFERRARGEDAPGRKRK
jgi:hypothetical protein